MSQDYKAIKLHEIYANQILGFDVYLRLPTNNKYLKYIHGASAIDEDQLRRLKFRNVDELYVQAIDFHKYNQLIRDRLRKKLSNKNLTDKEKTEIIKKETARVFDAIDSVTDEEDAIAWTNQCVEMTTCLTSDLTDSKLSLSVLSKKLRAYLSDEPSLINHSLAVSSLSVVLGMLLGIHESKPISELTIGGLLHDIGLKNCSSAIINKYLKQKPLTPEEMLVYKKHPTDGLIAVSKLLKATTISDNVLNIINEHHENPLGKGFPRGLSRFRQSYLAKIVTLADALSVRILNEGMGFGLKSHFSWLILDEDKATIKTIDKDVLEPLRHFVTRDK